MSTGNRCRLICSALTAVMLLVGCASVETEPPIPAVDADARSKAITVAEAAYEAGSYLEALQEYKRLLAANPKDEAAQLGAADCYAALGETKQAMPAYETLMHSVEPKIRVGAMQGRGISLLIRNEIDLGYAQLLDVVHEDPSLWRAWNGLGWCYDKKQDWAQASEAYSRAAELSPAQHIVLNNWGMSLLAQGDAGGAAGLFNRALLARPNFEVARTNLQIALGLQGKYREAVNSNADRKSAALNNVGYAALVRGDIGTASDYFLRSIDENPRFSEKAWKNLKIVEESDGL